jgi:protein-S-isoprenylcysteine O-methyltransferase Ste14
MPGIVALAVPAAWARFGALSLAHPVGLVVVAVGLGLLLWCVRDFYVSGKGALAPWQPPVELVVVGLYRHSRNPMYVAVTTMLLGWALSFASVGMLVYAAGIVTAFHLRVVFGEEPVLARSFGVAWSEYAQRVPRWLW